MTHLPKDPEFKQKVEESFNRQGFMHHLGAELATVEPGFCEIHIPFQQHLTQQHGFFHAGVVSTIADNCAGYASFSLMEPNSSILTVEFKLNLISPAKGDKLIGKATVLKHGKTLTICRSDIFVEIDGKQKLCAAAQSTLIELQNRSDSD